MKYSIHGFYQPRAVELGLTNDDLLVLRWFVDFAGTNKMKTIIENDGIYYWINYATILEDLPVLNISKVTLKRKHFDKLCETQVLKHKHIKQGGSFSYYAYGINYDTLVYLQDDTPSTNLDNPYDENVQTKINLLNNPSTNNKSINNKFIKPTIDEVKQYCLERNNNIDAEKFVDYYDSIGWLVGKKPMKDWKACVRTWEKKEKEVKVSKSDISTPDWFNKKIEKKQDNLEELEDILNDFGGYL